MGLRDDLDRFKKIGEEERQDLQDYIQHGNLSTGEIKIPIKMVELPEFVYDQYSQGGVGKGEGDVGDPVEQPGEQGEGDEEGEPGEEEGEHGQYEMDPEEFAEELDDRLGLDLEPKGKKIKEITEGALVEKVRTGPDATVDFEELFKKGLKRELALHFDEDYVREVLKVRGMAVQSTFEWARDNNIPVSKGWIEQEYDNLSADERTTYDSIEDIDRDYQRVPASDDLNSISLRREDKRHKHPEITKEYEKNAVVVFIRDVSGSMRQHKRELVERVFTPLDWYLTGKYDEAKFHYIVHDSTADEVDRNKFFGMKSGGGTRISTAYELTQEILDNNYPWADWNRYVFAAGDGENFRDDSKDNVVPLMEEIDANLHAYLEVKSDQYAYHGEIVEEELGEKENVAVTYVEDNDDVMDSIEEILSTEGAE
jgi:uncharacterized sporulation protein YeaH/YhbH (DUF444 family)